MPFSAPTAAAVALLCLGLPAGPVHGQSVGVGFDWLRDGGGDFPGGPGVRVEASMPIGRHLGVRGSLARWWGTDTRMGTLCTGLIPPNVDCLGEPIEHRGTVTAVDAFLLVRSPQRDAVRATAGVGMGHYGFDVSRYGKTSDRTIHPFSDGPEHGWVPAFLAELDFHPASWGPLGVAVGARTATVEFRGVVADAWALYGRHQLARLSLTTTYRLR